MARIAFVVPYPEMASVIEEAWHLHRETYKKTKLNEGYDFEYFIDCAVSPANVSIKQYDADVIVSRGGTALGLKEMNYHTPIVEIPLTSADIMTTIENAVRHYGQLPIGIVGTENMVWAVSHLRLGPGLDVKVFPTPTVEMNDLIRGVNEAVKSGRQIVIGGINTAGYCAANSIKSEVLVSSTESIFQSITEAKRCAVIANAERRKSVLFSTILAHTFEGMIAADTNGRILTLNPAAARMLGIKQGDYSGQRIEIALPPSRLTYILQSGRQISNEPVRVGANQFVINSVPMSMNGSGLGALVTFRSASDIVEAESRIRDKIYARGHVARYRFDDIVGTSPALISARRQAESYARVDSNILLFGETGTGKELFAQSIHNESERRKGPFVAVNCAALPENLMESELFGYVSGAFTGASKSGKAGLFELAHTGTILLDEISEIPPPLQTRLLRVIQEREIMRLGHDRVIPIDVRVICATNKNLASLASQGKFREDLYYRLNVLSIELPPLRERGDDLALMMKRFIDHYAETFGKGAIKIDDEAFKAAMRYDWPGNIRELRNICEQLAVLSQSGRITRDDVCRVLPHMNTTTDAEKPKHTKADVEKPKRAQADTPIIEGNLRDMERERIIWALNQADSREQAARMLGIGRSTLWRKCREYNLN